VHRHRFDTDPDPNSQFDAEPDHDADWHQNDAESDPYANPTQRLTHVEKRGEILLLFTAMSILNVFLFSLVAKVPRF
jgi:hypothetical protein